MKKRSNRRPKEIRELDAKVKQLERYLLNFYKRKIKKLAFTQGIPIEFFIQKYEEEIEIQVRQFVEDVYMTRIKNLEKEILKNQRSKSASIRDIFTSLKDLDNIKRIVSTIKDKFFNSVGRLIGRANTSDFNPATQQLEARTPFRDTAAMHRVAIEAGYSTFNDATQNKLEQIDSDAKVRYTTADDELVCQICSPLDGNIYSADDPSAPEPPLHSNCRCWYDPLIESIL